MTRAAQLALLLAATALIGVVDVVTGPDLGFSLFYLGPIALAGWRSGPPHSWVVASAAAVAWLVADVAADREAVLAISAWNGFTRLVIFNAVAALLVRLRREVAHHREIGRLREELLYSVAHELRNPLGVLENSLDLLSSEGADMSVDESKRLLGSAQRTAGRLRALMEDLLSAGSIRSGRFSVHPETVALGSLIADASDVMEPSLRQREQRLEVRGAEGAEVRVDRRYGRQLLANLIGNASKYGPHGGAIRVSVDVGPEAVRVTVADDGPGIPEGERAEVFERFYRAAGGGEEPGIGLGLAIAKGIVEAHGGRIGIDGAPSPGTRVWFTLPNQAGE